MKKAASEREELYACRLLTFLSMGGYDSHAYIYIYLRERALIVSSLQSIYYTVIITLYDCVFLCIDTYTHEALADSKSQFWFPIITRVYITFAHIRLGATQTPGKRNAQRMRERRARKGFLSTSPEFLIRDLLLCTRECTRFLCAISRKSLSFFFIKKYRSRHSKVEMERQPSKMKGCYTVGYEKVTGTLHRAPVEREISRLASGVVCHVARDSGRFVVWHVVASERESKRATTSVYIHVYIYMYTHSYIYSVRSVYSRSFRPIIKQTQCTP